MNLSKRIAQPWAITKNKVILKSSLQSREKVFFGIRRWVLVAVEREVAEDIEHQLGADLNMRVGPDER